MRAFKASIIIFQYLKGNNELNEKRNGRQKYKNQMEFLHLKSTVSEMKN